MVSIEEERTELVTLRVVKHLRHIPRVFCGSIPDVSNPDVELDLGVHKIRVTLLQSVIENFLVSY